MGTTETGYRSPKTLSRFAMAAIGLVAFCELMAALIGFAQLLSPGKTVEIIEGDASSLWLMMQGLVGLVQFPVYIFSVVMFLVWLHRVYTNLPPLRSDSTEFTPGWAVGWWFIPFANLVKPFQVVRNAWCESDPDFDPDIGVFSSIQAGAPTFMAIWWGFWILSNIAANITGRVYDPEDMRTVELSGYLFVLTGILSIIAAGLAIKVIMDITGRQDDRFSKIGLLRQYTPPPPPAFDGRV